MPRWIRHLTSWQWANGRSKLTKWLATGIGWYAIVLGTIRALRKGRESLEDSGFKFGHEIVRTGNEIRSLELWYRP